MAVKNAIAALASAAFFGSVAYAESVEEMCIRVSGEWGSVGDVPTQCACLASVADEDQSIADELFELAETYSSDEEAYEGASDKVKAAFDQCAEAA